jgi:hypothetical protein
MKVIIIVQVWSFLFCCCNNQDTNSTRGLSYFERIEQRNERMLDSLGLLQLNDTAKWMTYTMQGLDSATFGRNRDRVRLSKVPLCFLNLRLLYLDNKNDTLYLLYTFFYSDTVSVEQVSSGTPIMDGIVFDVKKREPIGYMYGEGITWRSDFGDSCFACILKPDIINFMRNNRHQLNPWFREEAKRRKVIE